MATEWAPVADQDDPTLESLVVVGRSANATQTLAALAQSVVPIAINDSLRWLMEQAGLEFPPTPYTVYPPSSGRGWPR